MYADYTFYTDVFGGDEIPEEKFTLMEFSDRLILKKRMIIECVINFLKFICQIEHTRHRSVANFIVNVVAALVAYSYILNKPRIVFINNSSTMPIFAA